jgi:hypothetical protein
MLCVGENGPVFFIKLYEERQISIITTIMRQWRMYETIQFSEGSQEVGVIKYDTLDDIEKLCEELNNVNYFLDGSGELTGCLYFVDTQTDKLIKVLCDGDSVRMIKY